MTIRSSATPKVRVRRSGKAQWNLLVVLLTALPFARAVPSPSAEPSNPLVSRLGVTGSSHLSVQGSINGHPARFVVDTACPITIIDSAVYPKLAQSGAEPARVGRAFYPASLGYRATTSGSIADLRIGGASLGGVTAAVTSLDTVLGRGITGRGSPDADGILGSDLLARYGAIIDLKSGTLSFDTRSVQKEALARRAASEGYTAVEMSRTSGEHLAVPCLLGHMPYRLVVDTGSPFTVMQRAVLSSSDLVRPSRVSYMRTLGGATTVAWLPVQNWSIGDFPVNSTVVGTGNFRGGLFAEHTGSGGQVEGLLGLEWLAHWRAIIDFGTRKVYLKQSQTHPVTVPNAALAQPRAANSNLVPGATAFQQPRQTKTR